jgi:hypothetical protein
VVSDGAVHRILPRTSSHGLIRHVEVRRPPRPLPPAPAASSCARTAPCAEALSRFDWVEGRPQARRERRKARWVMLLLLAAIGAGAPPPATPAAPWLARRRSRAAHAPMPAHHCHSRWGGGGEVPPSNAAERLGCRAAALARRLIAAEGRGGDLSRLTPIGVKARQLVDVQVRRRPRQTARSLLDAHTAAGRAGSSPAAAGMPKARRAARRGS